MCSWPKLCLLYLYLYSLCLLFDLLTFPPPPPLTPTDTPLPLLSSPLLIPPPPPPYRWPPPPPLCPASGFPFPRGTCWIAVNRAFDLIDLIWPRDGLRCSYFYISSSILLLYLSSPVFFYLFIFLFVIGVFFSFISSTLFLIFIIFLAFWCLTIYLFYPSV